MRAKPILSLSLLASALALPGTSAALGLGKLTVNSALGQPLSAQIELTSAAREELDSLAARIASPSLYTQNNLTYPGALSRARISVERAANGEPFLKITTQTPVSEPYLDLLVEINWASGRLVRDYTFLLDPPGSTMMAAPVEPIAPARTGAAPQRAPSSAAAPAPETAAPKQAGDRYTVKRGDTLSKIANENLPSTATLDQMLVALFRNNADAFDGKNMNRLRTGAIITIPSADEVGTTVAPEATKIVRVQASDWRTYRDSVAAAAPASEGTGGRAAAGKIGTAVDDRVPSAPAGRDQLKVSREAGQGKAASAAEEAVARDQALKEAQSRIAELEKTLRDLQRAVELKSQTGAQLQAQAGAAKGATPPAAPPVVAPAAPITKAPEPAVVAKAPEPAKAEPPKAEPAKTEPPKAEPPKAAEPPPAEAPKAAEPAKTEPPPSEPPKAAAPKSVPKAVTTKEPPGFFEDLFANTPSWMIGAAALVVLGGIAGIVAARRRKTTKFEDSIISGTDIKTNTVFGSTGGGVVNTGDNSLASDFSREGLGNIDTDEVDPIAEAEVYLAYGRDAQAEEILKEALKKDPNRQEIYLKLLEIHAQHNKPSAFETVAAELYSISQGQGEVWQKAVGLGRQLDPNNPMFAESGSAAAAAAAAAVAASGAKAAVEEPIHAEPEMRAEAAPSSAPVVPPDVASDIGDAGGGLDFKLDEEISISPSSGAKQKSPMDILAGAESALEKTAKSASAATSSAIESASDRPKSAAAVVHDMDFTLDASDRPAPARQPTPKQPEPALAMGPASTLALGPASTTAPSLARPQAAIDLDKLDLSFDPEKATFEDPTPSVLDGQWHDAATKLDLAKAYQEMGDVEGAREILQEVLHEGDDQQKSEAQSLLSKLG